MFALIEAADIAALHSTIAVVDAVPFLGGILASVLDLYLVKTALPMALLWLLWLWPSGRIEQRLELMIASLAGLAVGLFIGRAGQLLLPSRLRPISDPDMVAALPLPGLAGAFEGWSAFPSDHATLAGAMIAAAFALSRAAGLGLALWLAVLNLLPRLYIGVHWWTDVLAGLALGFAATWTIIRLGPPRWALAPARRLVATAPALALAGLFLVSFEIATQFDGSRGLAQVAARGMKRLAGV